MKTILSWRRFHYLTRVIILLIMGGLIAGLAGCFGYNPPPPSQNLEIRDWYDLDAIRDNLSGDHILMNDLDSTTPGYDELASPTANGRKGWEAIGWGYWGSSIQPLGETFKGCFDGRGYVIRDLFIKRDSWGGLGLFGCIGEEGIVKNISVVNATVTTPGSAGGLLALNESTVRSLDVSPMLPVGVLVGYNAGTVSNCYAMGDVVTGEISGDVVGGLVGDNGGTVRDSYFAGNVTGDTSVGGLVGYNSGTLSNSYSIGKVMSAVVVGGVMGVGGLVGFGGGTVSNSYYNYDELLINGEKVITIGALFSEDFEEWLVNDKFLDVNERLYRESGYCLINDVSDFKQLLVFGQDDTLKFRLTNDLDLSNEPNFHIPYLAGEFEGNGHIISNLSFNFDFISQVGLFGYLASGGKVTGVSAQNVDVTGYCYIGGLVGDNDGTVIESCSSGKVTGNRVVGGLVGANGIGTISNSYSSGNVTAHAYAGGLVGHNCGAVSKSYSSTGVTGDWSAGGLVGLNPGTVSDSFWDIETSGQFTSYGGTGKNTTEMQDISTFSGAGWDIITVANLGTRNPSYIWNIVNYETYPFLSWQSVS